MSTRNNWRLYLQQITQLTYAVVIEQFIFQSLNTNEKIITDTIVKFVSRGHNKLNKYIYAIMTMRANQAMINVQGNR